MFSIKNLSDSPEQDSTATTPDETPSILSILKAHLVKEDWKFKEEARSDTNIILKCGAQGKNGNFDVTFDIKLDHDLIILYIISKLKFPEAHRNEVALFLSRANFGLITGNFEIDLNDGEVRYKTTMKVPNTTLSGEMIEAHMQPSLVTMDRHFAEMVKVGYGMKTAAEGYESVSGGADFLLSALQEMVSGSNNSEENGGSEVAQEGESEVLSVQQ